MDYLLYSDIYGKLSIELERSDMFHLVRVF
jgi:hypothetical protein